MPDPATQDLIWVLAISVHISSIPQHVDILTKSLCHSERYNKKFCEVFKEIVAEIWKDRHDQWSLADGH